MILKKDDLKHNIKIAEENIKCYKMLLLRENNYYTPIRHKKVANKNEIINSILVPDQKGSISNYSKEYINNEVVIEEGIIHLYSSLPTALNKKKFDYNNLYFIFECIIPKGTEYIISSIDKNFIGSKLIKFIKLCA